MPSFGPAFSNTTIRLAQAIKVAEGSNPEWNNPGDLTYSFGYPTYVEPANSSGVLKFLYAEDGWTALCHQCDLMLFNHSKTYSLTDTLSEVGRKYSGGNPAWAANVAKELGVSEITTLWDLAEFPRTANTRISTPPATS